MMKDLTPFAKALWIDLAKQKDPWDPGANDLQTCFSFISCNFTCMINDTKIVTDITKVAI